METHARYVFVGSFVVFLLAALVIVGLWLARFEFGEHANFYDIYFKGSVTGLNQGSAVLENGIPIGRVTEIRLDPEDPTRVRVTVALQTGSVIRSNAVASLEVQGLTGGAFVNITGGSREASPLARQGGQRYPVIASKPSGLQQVVTNAPEALSHLIALTNQLSEVFSAENRQAITETLENMRRLTATAASHSGEIDSAISDGTASLHELRITLETAQAILASLNQVIGPSGDLTSALQSFKETSKKFALVADQLNAALAENRPELRNFGRNGLDQIEQLVTQTQALVAQLSRIADDFQRDPSRIIYGDQRQGYQPQ